MGVKGEFIAGQQLWALLSPCYDGVNCVCGFLVLRVFFFFEVKFTQHKINHFNMYNSIAFSTFTVLYNFHPSSVGNISIAPKEPPHLNY